MDVVVVIATKSKDKKKLINRALRSVYGQSFKPLCVYIVESDENPLAIDDIKKGIGNIQKELSSGRNKTSDEYPHTIVIQNQRTRGKLLAAAWNTGAQNAYRTYGQNRKIYLALLHEDDEWFPNYLQDCMTSVSKDKGHVGGVLSSFSTGEKETLFQVTPYSISMEAVYRGKCGWRESNTFVDLRLFWAAGGFDEYMKSMHERDFAIRFIQVCKSRGVQINVIGCVLWAWHCSEKPSAHDVSQGLDVFYYKYQSMMPSDILKESLDVSLELFKYIPLRRECSEPTATNMLESFSNAPLKSIVIGCISSSVQNIKRQLQSVLEQLAREPDFSCFCTYIVLTNGAEAQEITDFLLSEKPGYGLKIMCFNIEKQRELMHIFPYAHLYESEPLDEKSIAFSRTLLQFVIWREFKETDAVVMVLDDDMLFESLLDDGQAIKKVNLNFFGKLMELSEAEADIIISKATGAPPLPFYSSLRVQLVDVYFALCRHNQVEVLDFHGSFSPNLMDDYYYDLSQKHFKHLELPFEHQELASVESCYKAIKYLTRQVNLCRLLAFCPDDWNSLLIKDGFHRGGIAIFNKVDLLIKVPHLAPRIAVAGTLCRTRRSDFLATIGLVKGFGIVVKEACFPLHHDRHHQEPCSLGKDKVMIDLFGSAFYRTWQKSFEKGVGKQKLQASFEYWVQKSATVLELNSLRVSQLTQQIKSLILQTEMEECEGVLKQLEIVNHFYTQTISKQYVREMKRQMRNIDVCKEIDEIKVYYQ